MHVADKVMAILFFLGHGIFIYSLGFFLQSVCTIDFLYVWGGEKVCYLLLGGILLLKIYARGMAAELTSA